MLYFFGKGTELSALWSLEARNREDQLHVQRPCLRASMAPLTELKYLVKFGYSLAEGLLKRAGPILNSLGEQGGWLLVSR